MKFFLMSFFILVIFILSGCGTVSESFHENHASQSYFDCTGKQVVEAIKTALPALDYKIETVADGIASGNIEGEDFQITYKESAENKTTVYVRTGFLGDIVKEKRIIEEIKKNLH